MALTDGFHRQFAYLRLSVTDACNFRCSYCLPNGYQKTERDAPLRIDEIRRLTQAFAGLGFWKVRLTGGEPTLRQDIVEIARAVKAVPGIERVALSTNAYRLRQLAPALKEAGVSHVNVSIDSLDPARFHEITGHDRLQEVLAGVETARAVGMAVKTNAVLLRDTLEHDLEPFLAWARERDLSVRFIELMRTGDNGEYFAAQHTPASALQARLLRLGWHRRDREEGSGPAVVFEHAQSRGTVGIIAPYSADFCTTCNRLRVSCRGDLRLCLFGEGGYPLRALLQDDSQREELQATVQRLLGEKQAAHSLQEGKYGSTRHFAGIGG